MTVFALSNMALAAIIIPGWTLMGICAISAEQWWENRK